MEFEGQNQIAEVNKLIINGREYLITGPIRLEDFLKEITQYKTEPLIITTYSRWRNLEMPVGGNISNPYHFYTDAWVHAISLHEIPELHYTSVPSYLAWISKSEMEKVNFYIQTRHPINYLRKIAENLKLDMINFVLDRKTNYSNKK